MNVKNNKKQHKTPVKIILLLIIIGIATMIFIRADFKFNLSNIFIKTEKTASSTAILKQIKDISRLDSIEFIYKTVFPWDLVDNEIDLNETLSKYKAGDKIDFKEAEALSVYGIASEAGIDLLSDSYEFAVISSQVKAGWKFPEKSDDIIVINKETNTIIIKMPPAEITEIIIEDTDSSTYNYPDLDVSPEQWKTLTSIISRKVEAEAEQRGILYRAEERGQELIRKLLENSGFTEVQFID